MYHVTALHAAVYLLFHVIMSVVITEKYSQTLFLKRGCNQRIELQCRTQASPFFALELKLKKNTHTHQSISNLMKARSLNNCRKEMHQKRSRNLFIKTSCPSNLELTSSIAFLSPWKLRTLIADSRS